MALSHFLKRRMRGIAIAAAQLPLAWLAVRALRDQLGANPVEELQHATAEWALRLVPFAASCAAF